MALVKSYNFHCNGGSDWHREIRVRDVDTWSFVKIHQAMMDVRNTNFVLALRLDAENGRCVVLEDGTTIQLHLTAEEIEHYFRSGNYPGAVQAVGFWGIGRSYLYDLLVWYTNEEEEEEESVRGRLMRGFFYVDPNITRPDEPDNLPLPIGRRGSHVQH